MARLSSKLQRKICVYLASIAEDGTAMVTQEELASATGSHRGAVVRSVDTLVRKGVLSKRVVRATFLTILSQAGEARD